MDVAVQIEEIEGRGFRATAPEPFNVFAEAPTREQVIERIHGELSSRVARNPEIVTISIDSKVNPWDRVYGMYANDPAFDEWVALMAEYRDKVDAEEGIS